MQLNSRLSISIVTQPVWVKCCVTIQGNVDSRVIFFLIDFIRTFTWDKKLEMYVKASGILGGQGRMPTVVSPELYRTRFTEAMHRYFLMVPDKWTGLGNDLD